MHSFQAGSTQSAAACDMLPTPDGSLKSGVVDEVRNLACLFVWFKTSVHSLYNACYCLMFSHFLPE